jgi:phenylacetate-CoA ligase
MKAELGRTGKDSAAGPELAGIIHKRIRDMLVFTAQVDLVLQDTLQRSEYKSRLVQR